MKTLLATIFAALMMISTAAFADPVGGQKEDSGVLSPGEVEMYRILLEGDEMTRFRITGDGDGDIDCFLYDSHLNVVNSNESYKDGCVLDITPSRTDIFFFKVVNVGRMADRYTFWAY